MMKTFKCAYVYINIVTERHQFFIVAPGKYSLGQLLSLSLINLIFNPSVIILYNCYKDICVADSISEETKAHKTKL